jgi:hypothetical protein
MGSSRWSPDDWSDYKQTTVGKPQAAVFKARNMQASFDPSTITVRESVDSDANPNSTPIIVALDVTGSMGMIPQQLVQGNLGTLMQELLDRRPVSDPHLMFMGVGDIDHDRSPLQVTQFEADIKIAEQLREIWLEGGGGGNGQESYHLPWYFAATKTSCDAIAKRGKKGYLFTVGDESPPKNLRADQIKSVFGVGSESDLSSADILSMAERFYNVYHIVIEQGGHYQGHRDQVQQRWREMLGERVILLSDYTKLAEVIVSTIQLQEGADHDAVSSSWSNGTDLVVAHALKGLSHGATQDGGLVVL